MAKGQKRSGREPKKPKAAKKPVGTGSVFNRQAPTKQPPAPPSKSNDK